MKRRPSTIGTFDADGLHVVGPGSCEYLSIGLPRTVLDAWDIARRLDIRQLWLTTGAARMIGLPDELDRARPEGHGFLASGSLRHPGHQKTLSPWLTFWSGDGEHRLLEIAVPGWDRYSPFAACADFAPSLAGEVGEFNERTGMLWRRNGQTTSDAWLRENLSELRATEAPEPSEDGNLEADLKFVRELTERERRARYVHAYDANAMYLGAASSLALPVGECRHSVGEAIEPGPGYFHMLPGEWWTRPTLDYRFPETLGLFPESYTWAESHRFLEAWYRHLRDARNQLITFGPSPALDAVKATYRQGIGQLASHRKDKADALYQPYWRHAIQAEARSRLQRRIASLTTAPFAVDVDCLFVMVNIPDPVVTAQRIGVPLGDGIGQFKVKGSTKARLARLILDGERGANALAPLRSEVAA